MYIINIVPFFIEMDIFLLLKYDIIHKYMYLQSIKEHFFEIFFANLAKLLKLEKTKKIWPNLVFCFFCYAISVLSYTDINMVHTFCVILEYSTCSDSVVIMDWGCVLFMSLRIWHLWAARYSDQKRLINVIPICHQWWSVSYLSCR